MTVAAKASSVEYVENGVTVSFPVPFRFVAPNAMRVTRVGADGSVTELAYGSQWNATGGATDEGGMLTLLVPSVSGARLRIQRTTPRAQQADYATNDTFPAESHEAALDRAMLIDQEQDVRIADTAARALLVPDGEIVLPLPVAGDRVGKFLTFDGNGNPIPAEGTGVDPGLREDLVNKTGATHVMASHLVPGAPAISLLDRFRLDVYPEELGYGAAGNSDADNTAAFQEAVAYVAQSSLTRRLRYSNRIYKLTDTITSEVGLAIEGEDVAAYAGNFGSNTIGGGSWLHFAHEGVGLLLGQNNPAVSGFSARNFGTYRDQPTPAPGWEPADHDFDIQIYGQVELENLCLLNATRAVKMDEGNYARANMNNIYGQWMKVGIHLSHLYDVVFLDKIRRWSFWSHDSDVIDSNRANCRTLEVGRMDGLFVGDMFSIHHLSAVHIIRSEDGSNPGIFPGGSLNKGFISNLYSDFGTYAVVSDPDVTGFQLFISKMTAMGAELDSSFAIALTGDQARLRIGYLYSEHTGGSVVSCAGDSNHVWIDTLHVNGWNESLDGFPAVSVSASSRVSIKRTFWEGSAPNYGGGGAAKYDGLTIDTAEWRDVVGPSITPSSGAITTWGVNSAKYRRMGGVVDVSFDFSITTNGPGAGFINLGLPITAAGTGVLNGIQNVGGATKQLMASISSPATAAAMTLYDGTYPGANGAQLRLEGSYPVEAL